MIGPEDVEVKAGRFREDLYYRLAVVELKVPSLSERREEIPVLARALARKWGERFGLGEVSISPELAQLLTDSAWPGNVRQLENTIARMIALYGTNLNEASFQAATSAPTPSAQDDDLEREPLRNDVPLREQTDAFERGILQRVLRECGGNQSEAARRLAIGRVTLIDKMKKHGLREA